jgi:hypothetical protein
VKLVAEIGRARAAGAIRDLDYYLAVHLLALAPQPSAELALAIAAVSRANGDGDVCLDLGAIAGSRVLADERPVGNGAQIDTLTEEDVLAALLDSLEDLVER